MNRIRQGPRDSPIHSVTSLQNMWIKGCALCHITALYCAAACLNSGQMSVSPMFSVAYRKGTPPLTGCDALPCYGAMHNTFGLGIDAKAGKSMRAYLGREIWRCRHVLGPIITNTGFRCGVYFLRRDCPRRDLRRFPFMYPAYS